MKIYLPYFLLIVAISTSQIVFAQATLVTNPASGHYCQGSSAVQIQIDHSQNGITYNLRRQGQTGNLATATGNGNTITFSSLYQAGTYLTVPATNTVTIVMDPVPSMFVFSATNNGAYCNYPGTSGVQFIIQPTQLNVKYILFIGNTAIDSLDGVGNAMSFGNYSTPGAYKVVARTIAGCSRTSSNINVVAYSLPNADFHSDHDTPPSVCASMAINFTSNSTGNGLKYFWDFHDSKSGVNDTVSGSPASHVFEAYGNATQTYGVLLKVTDNHGCIDTITKPVTVIQKPDATLNENLWLPNSNFPNTFAACNATLVNPDGAFEFVNGSSTIATNTFYSINWGDPTIPNYSAATFTDNLPVDYHTSGYSHLTYTINGQNGCNNTKIYNVFVGNFAGGGLGNPGNTAGTANFCIDFPIQPESYDNPPGTKFIFEWGDGASETVLRENLPANHLLSHCYTSCSTTLQGIPPKYGYKAICNTENPCGSIETSVTPIVVSCKVDAKFSAGTEELFGGNSTDTIVGCNDVTFRDMTQAGFYITPPSYNTYTTNTFYTWDFGDPASNSNNTSNLPNPTHHFTTSGSWYTVTMIAFTGTNANFNSGRDTVVNQIYIQTPPVAAYKVSAPDTCSPIQVAFTDQSTIGGWGIPEYRWRITPNSGWSIITPDYVGDSTYHSPVVEFTAVGKYNVNLVLQNSCGISELDTNVIVCQPPKITVAPSDIYLCGPGTQKFTPAYNMNCDTTFVSYRWQVTPASFTFVDGTNASSKYPHISFTNFDDYIVKAIIANSCGSDSAIQNVHITQLISNNIISPGSPASGEICAGQAPVVLNGTIPAGGHGSFTYQWQENLTCDLSGSGTWSNIIGATTQNYAIMSPLASNRCFRRIAYDASDCSSTSNTIQIVVNPAISNNIITADQQICAGSSPNQLTGTQSFGGSSTPTYQWENSPDGITFSVIVGATSQNYQAGVLNASIYFRRAAISSPCTSNYSAPILITVCDPIAGNTITADQTICQATAPAQFTGTTPTGACGIYTYQWQSATEASYPTFTDISGANAISYQAPALSTKTYFRRVITSSVGNCLLSTSNEITINILSRPTADAGLIQTITNGATTNLSGSATGGTLPYSPQWTPVNRVQPPATSFNVTTTNLSASTEFTLTVTDANGCKGTDNVWVMVNGSPLSVNITANPAPICPNTFSHLCANAGGGTGNYTYSWTSPGNLYPTTQCIDVDPAATTTYTCVVWDGFVSDSAKYTLIVDPSPVITSPLMLEICNGEQLNYSPVSTIANSSFTWTSTSGGNCSGNTNSGIPGSIITDYLNNSGNTDCVVTYLVSPIGPVPTSCPGNTETLEVTVKPVAYITNTVASQTVVSGYPTEPVTFNSNVSSAGFHWEYTGTTSPGFVQLTEYGGYTSTLPSQTVSLLPGAPATSTLSYSIQPFVMVAVGDTCWGNIFTYHLVINSEPVKYNLICPSPICIGQTATVSLSKSDIGIDYKLYRGATYLPPAITGTGAQLDWTGLSIAGGYTIRATNPTNGQSTLMNGLCQITINPLPQIFLLTALNGEHCSPVTLELSGSEAGINYYLIKDGDISNPVQVKAGTGSAGFLVFNPVSDSGEYTVNAVNPLTNCDRTMTGSIHIDALIKQFASYPGGIICAGENLCLDGSEPGIEYQLWLDDSPTGIVIAGDALGGSVCFGNIPNAGTYRIHAKNPVTKCEIFFDKSVVINPLPLSYTVSPVQGCAGTEIVLYECQPGVEYYLYFTPTNKKSPMASFVAGPLTCAGGTVSFGKWYDEGVYEIQAKDVATDCFSWMTGTTTIHPEPEAFNLVPQGPACPPANISLDGFELDATYYLYRDNNLVSTVDGTNGSVDFGIQTMPGNYTVRAQFKFTGGFECWKDMKGSVDIYPLPVVDAGPATDTICSPPSASVSLNGFASNQSGVIWSSPTNLDGSNFSSSGSLNTIYTFTSSDLINKKVTLTLTALGTGICTGGKVSDSITIHLLAPIIDPGADRTVCMSEPVQLNGSVSGGATSGLWSTSGDGHFADITSLSTIYTPGVNDQSTGSVLLTLTSTNSSICPNLSKSTTISIYNNLVAGISSADQTICSGETPAALSATAPSGGSALFTYQWQLSTNNGTSWSDVATGGNTLSYSPSALTVTTLYRLQQTDTYCTPDQVKFTNSVKISVNNLTAGIIAADQTICENQTTSLTGTLPTTDGTVSYQWQTSSDGSSYADIQGASAQNYTTVALTADTWYRRIMISTLNQVLCSATSNTVKVTVNNLTAGVISSDQTICENQTASLTGTLPAGDGIISYQWQLSTDGTLFSDIANATSQNYTTTALITDKWYRRISTSILNLVSCSETSNTVKITVNNLSAGVISTDQTICENQAAALSGTLPAMDGAVSYQWQASADGSLYADINGATTQNYSTTQLIADTWYRRIATSTLNLVSCSATSNSVKVTVNNLTSGMISADQTICENQTASLTGTMPNSDGTVSYQWQASSDGSLFNDILNATTQNYTTVQLNADTWYRLIATSTLNLISCSATSNTVKITVNNLTAGVVTADQTVCDGQTAQLTGTLPSVDGVISYQWQASIDGSSFIDIAGATAQNYTTDVLTADTWYQRIATSTLNLVTCSAVSNRVKVTVNNLTAGVISADQTICESQSASLTGGLPVADGNLMYQWQSSNNGISFTDIFGAVSQNYVTGALTADTWYRRISTSTLNLVLCSATSNTIKVTVNNLTAGVISSDQTICENQIASLTGTLPIADGTISYQWQSSTNGTLFFDIANATSQNYTTFPLAADTWYRRVTASKLNLNVCTATSNSIKVTVNNLSAVIIAGDQTICEGQTASISGSLPVTDGSPTYQWQSSTDGSLFADIQGAVSQNYNTAALNADTWFRRIVTSTLNSVACSATSNNVKITVNNLSAGTVSADQIICEGQTSSLTGTLPDADGITSYQWQWSIDGTLFADITGATLQNYTSDALSADRWYRRVTTSTLNQVYCSATSNSVKVTVNNVTPGSISADQTICESQTAALTGTLPTLDGAITYQWQASIDGSLFADIEGATGQNYTTLPLTIGTWYRRVAFSTINASTCSSTGNIVKVSVYQHFEPGKVSADQSICYGQTPAKLTVTAPTGGSGEYKYQWQFSTDKGSTWADIIPGGNALTYSPSALFGSTLFRMRQTDTWCSPNQVVYSNPISIEVRVPTVFAGPDNLVCGLIPFVLSEATANHAVDYVWSTSGTGSFTGQYQVDATYFPTTADMKIGHVVLTLTISDNCGNVVSDDMTLTLSQPPVAYFKYSTPTCSNAPIYFTDQSAVSNGSINTWIWDFGDGTPPKTINFPDSPNTQHTYAEPGISYNVKLSVITKLGCKAEFQQPITTLYAAVANFSASQISCDNQPVQFTNMTQLNGSVGFQPWRWDFGDSNSGTTNTSTNQNPTHKFSSSGTFTVRLIVNNNNNCLDTISKEVYVHAHPPVDFTYSTSCLNEPVIFSPDTIITNVDSISNWFWDFGDGVNSEMQTPLHVFTSPGAYIVAVTITDIFGCENTISHTVTISPLPISYFDAGQNNCAGSTVHFMEHSSTTAGYVMSWIWDFGDGTPPLTVLHPDDPDVTHIYTNPGQYSVKLTVKASDNCSNTNEQVIKILPVPVANFEFQNACDSLPVSFTDRSQSNGSGNIIKWEWNFGDPNSGEINSSLNQNPSHVFSSSGTYTVNLTVTTTNGCNNSLTRTVTISAKPAVDFAWSNTCLSLATKFVVDTKATNIPEIQSFDWDFGDGTSHSYEQNPSHNYAAAKIYTVVLSVTDISGCSNKKSYSVTIKPEFFASFSHSSICLNTPVSFTDQTICPGGEPITNWQWNFGVNDISNDISDSQNPEWTYTSAGTYFVTFKATTQNGCSDSVTTPLQVFNLPKAAFSFNGSACSGGNILFSDSSSSEQTKVASWLWEFMPGAYTSSPNPVFGFPETGKCYNVKLTITDNKGCLDTVSKQVCVSPQLVADFNYSPTCLGNTTTFSILAPIDEALQSVSWNFGDPYAGSQTNTSVEKAPAHDYSVPGRYPVLLKVYDNNHCLAEKIVYVEVKSLPDPSFSYTLGVCDSTVYFKGLQTHGGSTILTWNWDFGDGQKETIYVATESVISHVYKSQGNYTPSLTITNSDNCSKTYTESILVKPCIQADFVLNSTPVCQNYEISFKDDSYSAMPITEWKWDFGDKTAFQSYYQKKDIVNHPFAQPGDYAVKLVVKTAIGFDVVSDSMSMNVHVQPTPVAGFTARNVCLDDTVVFRNQSTGNGAAMTSFIWNFIDPESNNYNSSEYNPVHLYPAEGDYQPTLILGNSAGCVDTVVGSLTIYSPPKADITVQNPCIGQPTHFIDESVNGSNPIITWNWSLTNTNGYWHMDTVQKPVIIFESTGEYLAQLTVSDTAGCKSTIDKKFTAKPSPKSGFSFYEKTDPLNEKWQLVLTNESTEAEKYEWDFGDGKNSMAKDPVTFYDNEGDYLIQLVSINSDLCTDTATKSYHLLFRGLYVPSAFSPQDPSAKLNIFQPKGEGIETFKIEVYDRWGNIIWSSDTDKLVNGQPGPGWDGKYQGEYVPIGIYVWKASAVFKDGSVWNGISLGENKGLSGTVYGTVTVIR